MELNNTHLQKINTISNEIDNVLHKHLDSLLSQQSNFEFMLKNIPFVKNIIDENNNLKNKCHTLEVELLEKKVVSNVDEKVELKIIDLPGTDVNNYTTLEKSNKKNVKINSNDINYLNYMTSDSEESDEIDTQGFSSLVNNLKNENIESVKNVMVDLNVTNLNEDLNEDFDDP